METGERVRVLMLEGDPADAENSEKALRNAGFDPEVVRVTEGKSFERALETFSPDFILLDNWGPGFDSAAALKLVRERHAEIPAILITSSLGDEAAVELVRAGATEYVLRENRERLGAAVGRALEEARRKQQGKIHTGLLATVVGLLDAYHARSTDGILIVNRAGKVLSANPRFLELFQLPPGECENAEEAVLLQPIADGAWDGQEFGDRIRKLPEPAEANSSGTLGLKDGRRLEWSLTAAFNGEEQCLGRVWAFRDITASRNAEHLKRALAMWRQVRHAVASATEAGQLAQRVCEILTGTGGYAAAWFLTGRSGETAQLKPLAWAGTGPRNAGRFCWFSGKEAPTAMAARTGVKQVCCAAADGSDCDPRCKLAGAERCVAGVAIPIEVGGERMDVLDIRSAEPHAFAPAEMELLEQVAEEGASGMACLRNRAEHAAVVERFERFIDVTVHTVAAALEKRDPQTAGHQRRVAALAAAMGRQMGLDDHALRGLELAGLVHDVGKIEIPAEILVKSRPLTLPEFELVKAHARAGYDIFKDIGFPWPIADVILQHHERLDGSGYPKGLRGEEILLEARIVAVADVVEAMVSHRPYRSALELQVALDEIVAGRGKKYDAAAVEACLRCFGNGFVFESFPERKKAPPARMPCPSLGQGPSPNWGTRRGA